MSHNLFQYQEDVKVREEILVVFCYLLEVYQNLSNLSYCRIFQTINIAFFHLVPFGWVGRIVNLFLLIGIDYRFGNGIG